MRILSQEGLTHYDIPYDKVCLNICETAKDGTIHIYAWDALSDSDSTCIGMATYSTKEKANRAMEMLRKAYSPIMAIKDQEDGIEANIKPNDWLFTPSLLTPEVEVSENFYFQFPTDEEVDV